MEELKQLGLTWHELITLVFSFAFIWYEVKSLRRDILRLEMKQDRYNHIQERVLSLEQWKVYHEKEHKNAK